MLKTAKDSAEVGTIKSASEALSNELQKIGEIMAKTAQEQSKASSDGASAQPGGQKTGPDEKGGNVRDAEFKEGDKK